MEMNLKMYLQHHYGSLKACADVLQVHRVTLQEWVNNDPEQVLRFTSKLVSNDGVEPHELIKAVFTTQKQNDDKTRENRKEIA